MKWEKGNVFDLCDINPENISRNYPYDFVRYYDITSVGSGVATVNDEIPLSEAPSRAKRVVKNSDTILATVRPGNKSYYYFKSAYENSIASTGFAVLRPKVDKTDPRFLYYLVSEPGFTAYLVAYEQGANYPAVNPDIIGNKPIVFPPLLIQRRIASILSTYDDLIENNLKRIKLLEEKAFLRYKSEFDFFKPSNGIYIIPEDWSVKRADEIFKINIGKTPPREQIEWFNDEDSKVKWVSIKDINNSTVFAFDASETVTEMAVSKFNMNVAKAHTVLLSFKLTVGKVAITTEDMTTNEAIAHFNIEDESQMCSEYIYFYLKNFPYDSLGSTSSIGTAINSKVVKAMPVLLPPKQVISEYKKDVANDFNLIQNLLKQNTKLREARDILLPKLISGQIEVYNFN